MHGLLINRYKYNGKSFEERAGRNDEGWDAEKASNFRIKRIAEKREQKIGYQIKPSSGNGRKWNYAKIFETKPLLGMLGRYKPTDEAIQGAIAFFRRQIAQSNKDASFDPNSAKPAHIKRYIEKHFHKSISYA